LPCGVAKPEGQLSPFWQIQSTHTRLCAGLLEEVLGLRACDACRLLADHAVNALAIDHNRDRETPVAFGQSLEGNAVLDELLAGF
jgi:hypothetical protein